MLSLRNIPGGHQTTACSFYFHHLVWTAAAIVTQLKQHGITLVTMLHVTYLVILHMILTERHIFTLNTLLCITAVTQETVLPTHILTSHSQQSVKTGAQADMPWQVASLGT